MWHQLRVSPSPSTHAHTLRVTIESHARTLTHTEKWLVYGLSEPSYPLISSSRPVFSTLSGRICARNHTHIKFLILPGTKSRFCLPFFFRVEWQLDSITDHPTQTRSQADSPEHVFTQPYRSHVVGVTVTSSLGKDTYAEAEAVDTTPTHYPFQPSPAVVDAHTIATLRADTLSDGLYLRDPHSNGRPPFAGVNLTVAGNPTLSNENLLWMENRSG